MEGQISSSSSSWSKAGQVEVLIDRTVKKGYFPPMFHPSAQRENTGSKAAAHSIAPGRPTIQRVGLPNDENYCFMNAVIQLVERSYANLFDYAKNRVAEGKKPLQKAVWDIIQNLRADENVTIGRIRQLRADFQDEELIQDLHEQEDASEFMVKLIDYVAADSDYAFGEGKHLLLQNFETTSDKTDIAGEVPLDKLDKTPSQIREEGAEFGVGIIGIDINIYNSFNDFLYYLYGTGTNTELDQDNYLRVVSEGSQVYVKARKEKRTFVNLPEVLTFYIKRFLAGYKNDRDFPMPAEVILVEAPSKDKKQYKKYRLEALVRHSGKGSLGGGHYYALKDNKDGQARKYNDDRIEDPSGDDTRQGSIYSYRLVETKDSLVFGEFAAQETTTIFTQAPNTKGVQIESRRKAWDAGGRKAKSTGFSPFIGAAPVPSDKIRGLPNRSRQTPSGESVVADCFINAVVQLLAGGYRELFDPSTHRVAGKAKAIQAAVLTLIDKVNQKDNTAIGDDDIFNLRKLLQEKKGVPTLHTQEDATELMLFLIGLMLDISERQWKAGEKDTPFRKTTPGLVAKHFGRSNEALLRGSNLGKNFIGLSVESAYLEDDLVTIPSKDDPGQIRHPHAEEPEPSQGLIQVDIGQIDNFDEFLFQRYGKGWERETFEPGDYPKVTSPAGEELEYSARFKHYRFNYLPPVISFLIKRFKHSGPDGKETKDYVLPTQLILVEQTIKGKKEYKHYELKGVVVHKGDSLTQGHYYTHRKEGADWSRADDRSVVREASPGSDLAQGVVYTYSLTGTSKALATGQRAPQEKYDAQDIIYTADSKLRPTDASGYVAPPKHRNSRSQGEVSGDLNALIGRFFPEANGVTFHAGHLFTSTLGGAGDARNLAPVSSKYNLGGYKDFEDNILTPIVEKADLAGKKVFLHIHAGYPADDSAAAVFDGILEDNYIQLLSDAFAGKKKPKDDQQKKVIEGIQNFYTYFIRLFRRVPIRMTAPEIRVVGGNGAREQNQTTKIGGSPRTKLGRPKWGGFLDKGEPGAPSVKLFGPPGKQPDFKGQDPDEWAVKTYAGMPEPGIYDYQIDSHGRTTGIDAYIWLDPEGIFSAYKLGGGTQDDGPAPAGFKWRMLQSGHRGDQNSGLFVRGHLLNGELHGSGTDPHNLTPLTHHTNTAMSKVFEEKIKQLKALTEPGKGIFWKTRLSGAHTRPRKHQERMARLRAIPEGDRTNNDRHSLALEEQEALLFKTIHLFAYEGTVGPDGKATIGKLLTSASFTNTFEEGQDQLGSTRPYDNFSIEGHLHLGPAYKALLHADEQVDIQHREAGESYKKPSPEKSKSTFSLEQGAKDIQGLLTKKLPGFYKKHDEYAKTVEDYAAFRKEVNKHRSEVRKFNDGASVQKSFGELTKRAQDLENDPRGFEQTRAGFQGILRRFQSMKTLALHHNEIAKTRPAYPDHNGKPVASLAGFESTKAPTVHEVITYPVKKRKKGKGKKRKADSLSSEEDDDVVKKSPKDKKKDKKKHKRHKGNPT